MKPPFVYYGGKTSIADRVAGMLSAIPHQHYVEPYCGSLSVLLAKQPAKMETVNDLDQELITFWRVLRDRPVDLERVCALTPHSRRENALCDNRDVVDELELARRVWVKLTQGRDRTLRSRNSTGWKHYVYPAGTSIGMPDYLEAYIERTAAAAARLHAVSLECMPALDIIDKYGVEPAVLLYVDPPYLGDTRNHRNNYKHEMRTPAEHAALAEALHAARAAVVVSGYACDLYDQDLYTGWHRYTLPAYTGNGQGDRARTEVLWSNRQLELALFAASA